VEIQDFIRQREQFTFTFAKALGVKPEPLTLDFFALARKGELEAASRVFHKLVQHSSVMNGGRPEKNLARNLWEPMVEVQLALEPELKGGGKYAAELGKEIAHSIPAGAIFFGGNRPERALAAAYATRTNGERPFMIVSQNSLSDSRHRAYLRFAYGTSAYMPTDQDAQACIEAYLEDARERYLHDAELPHEPRQLTVVEQIKIVDGKAQMSGHGSWMMVNGLIAKTVFDRNPEREFYVEESFPLDWMFPYLSPHGLIMKLNRQPVALTPEIVERDRSYWTPKLKRWIGGWLTPEMPVKDICGFAEKIFLRNDYAGFDGDLDFLRNAWATETYSKLRSAQAGVYQWHIEHSASGEEKQRMIQEADFAYRQALALCPNFTQVNFRYVNLLVSINRVDDALLVARTFGKLEPSNAVIPQIIGSLERKRLKD
jgi:hypothetical protein